MNFLFTGGLGDVISVESRLTDAEKSAVRNIYLATPAENYIRELLRIHTFWASLPVHTLLSREEIQAAAPGKFCVTSLADANNCLRRFNRAPLPHNTFDASIFRIFFELRSGARRYERSGFMFERKECNLFFHAATNANYEGSTNRNFTEAEKQRVYEYAEKKGLEIFSPQDGVTTPKEFYARAMGCKEFIGCDSSASIIAAIDKKENNPQKKIFVRSNNPTWYRHRAEWYATTDFYFGGEYL